MTNTKKEIIKEIWNSLFHNMDYDEENFFSVRKEVLEDLKNEIATNNIFSANDYMLIILGYKLKEYKGSIT